MDVRTHLGTSPQLVGAPTSVGEGRATAVLRPSAQMAVDDRGLVHGGFVFGLADYAAMLAVNDPNVVLGSADVRFTAPVRVGEALTASAEVEQEAGRKRLVRVTVRAGEREVLSGVLTCFVLDRHVLEGR